MLISVIIPVYRDLPRLKNCLYALANQKDFSFQDVEVIIVNNDASDLFELEDSYPFSLKLIVQEIPGSYAARNKGLEIASGESFLFTDSDCIPSTNWLSTAKKLLENTESDLIAGSIDLFAKEENRYVRFDQTFAFPNEYYVKEEKFGVTANLLVRKSVIEAVGSFNTQLLTGGDSEFCNRAINAGFKIAYHKELNISHPARASWDELKVKAIRFGGRLPKGSNQLMVLLKLIGKFRVRLSDVKYISGLPEVNLSQKFDFFQIRQKLRWVEAEESLRVFFGKKPGRK
ncbi:glycosyltransferase family 2 protein [Algoriphagus machipongonensis]|uniref:Rhamnosyl transferase n=1 Tax=Algoriphagus machipongonensis TaxID=388413 RepID=A3I1Y1_9BACT|nr:glycosyltransferase family A protein [Algoriphagus machipongonensis]EAZ79797.1 putative rhamnosyl transferase [Algoriphagus machipongonensis]